MSDPKKRKSGTFHSDSGQMDENENKYSNSSCNELLAESPVQIGKDETSGESLPMSPKELPSSQYRENPSVSP